MGSNVAAPPAGTYGLRAVLVVVFAFLYVPIAVLVALSFNEGGLPTVWSGFSLKWYVSLTTNEAIRPLAEDVKARLTRVLEAIET